MHKIHICCCSAHTHIDVYRSTSHAPIYWGIATGKGPHESTGTHNAEIWTWGTVLNLGDVICRHTPTLPLSPPHNCDNFKSCRRPGQFAYIQLDRRARRKQDQWPAWIHSHAKTGENETLWVSFSPSHTVFSPNLDYFTISCFVVLASQCVCESTLCPQWWLTLVYEISCLFFLDSVLIFFLSLKLLYFVEFVKMLFII